jgi:UDP-perosamine 4-acetyltransferase
LADAVEPTSTKRNPSPGRISKSPKKIVLLGGGGHCKVVLDVLEMSGEYQVYGITDLPERLGVSVLQGYKITHLDSDLASLYSHVRDAFVSHGENLWLRRQLFDLAKGIGYRFPVLISPYARVSGHAQLSEGTLVMHHATVNASSSIGSNVIVNTGATVEHDCLIGAHSHIAPGVVLCGGVGVGQMTLVGANSVVIPGISVGHNVVIGAGSVVTRNVPDNVLALGNPARIVHPRDCG